MAKPMDIERIEAIIARVRLKDSSVEWRSACDQVMDEIREELTPATGRKVRAIVEMFGGSVQGVSHDAPDVELDVVFLEDGKYLELDNRNEEEIVMIRDGESFVCDRHDSMPAHDDSVARLFTEIDEKTREIEEKQTEENTVGPDTAPGV